MSAETETCQSHCWVASYDDIEGPWLHCDNCGIDHPDNPPAPWPGPASDGELEPWPEAPTIEPAAVQAVRVPVGYRVMTSGDVRSVRSGSALAVLDTYSGTVYATTVRGFRRGGEVVTIIFRSGSIEDLELADQEMGETRGPRSADGQFVAVVEDTTAAFTRPLGAARPAPSQAPRASADCDLPELLRASNKIATIQRTLRALAEAIARLNDALQSRPTREEHDAVLADLAHLREQVRALSIRRAS